MVWPRQHDDDVSQAFIDDLMQQVDIDALSPSIREALLALTPKKAGESVSKAEASSFNKQAMETVEEMKSEVFQLRKCGFVENAIVVTKDSDVVALYRIDYVGNVAAHLVEVSDGHEGCKVEVKLETLATKYRLHKGKITEVLQGWHPESNPCSPLKSETWMSELVKSVVVLVMQQIY